MRSIDAGRPGRRTTRLRVLPDAPDSWPVGDAARVVPVVDGPPARPAARRLFT
ncbi:hypothetical protein [Desertihabitans aurantiacus]|uniref:hypothetical protein n=1 Tax=Desertihabitans aurantiacus TaxID=2282477 RepID=UPI001300B794|nr:hypothetical protein [Desertihabitans aurantiacus]